MARSRRLTGAPSVSDALENALRSVAPPSRDWQPRAGTPARTFARETDDGGVLLVTEVATSDLGRRWVAAAGRTPVVDGNGHVEMHRTVGEAQRAADALAERMMADEQEAERLSRLEAAKREIPMMMDFLRNGNDPGTPAILDAVMTMLDVVPMASGLFDALDTLSQAKAGYERALAAALAKYPEGQVGLWMHAWNYTAETPVRHIHAFAYGETTPPFHL